MNLFATINHWLHLTSVVFWIGGTAFEVLILAPLLQQQPLPAAFLRKLSNRFRLMSGPLILLLIITGGINFGVRRAGQEMPTAYITALGIKVFLVALVASVHFFMGLTPPDEDETAGSGRVSRTLNGAAHSRLTISVGLIIIFIAATLRHFKF
jgi:putative copper export protein